MPTSDDSAGFLARLDGPLLKVSSRPRLRLLATDIIRRHGEPQPSSGQPVAVLASAARKLAQTGGDLEALTKRERKAAIELFWLRMEGWTPQIADIRKWMAWASDQWSSRSGVNRIMMSYIRNFDPESDGTKEVSRWLLQRPESGGTKEVSQRQHMVTGPFGEFVRAHGYLEGASSVEQAAQGFAEGRQSFFLHLDQDIRSRTVVRGSGLLVQIAEAYGRKCLSNETIDTEKICRKLLDLFGESGLSGARGSLKMREQARVSMITGLVHWAKRTGERQSAVDLALEISLSLATDPRISPVHWRDIDAYTVNQVEAWLTERTVENMFRVIAALRTDRQDMVEERLAFWRGYLPQIKKAYLLCGRQAESIADGLNERYGSLRGMSADHCGLLLQIIGPQGDRITVLDFNKTASALFWDATSQAAPPFFDRNYGYHGQTMRDSADVQMRHTPNLWQEQFALRIERETGLRQAPVRSYA